MGREKKKCGVGRNKAGNTTCLLDLDMKGNETMKIFSNSQRTEIKSLKLEPWVKKQGKYQYNADVNF